jgi:hypothetical protein
MAIQAGLQNVSRDLESGLTPVIQRLVGGILRDVVEKTMVPAINGASETLGEKLLSDFKSEMLQ